MSRGSCCASCRRRSRRGFTVVGGGDHDDTLAKRTDGKGEKAIWNMLSEDRRSAVDVGYKATSCQGKIWPLSDRAYIQIMSNRPKIRRTIWPNIRYLLYSSCSPAAGKLHRANFVTKSRLLKKRKVGGALQENDGPTSPLQSFPSNHAVKFCRFF